MRLVQERLRPVELAGLARRKDEFLVAIGVGGLCIEILRAQVPGHDLRLPEEPLALMAIMPEQEYPFSVYDKGHRPWAESAAERKIGQLGANLLPWLRRR
jgi:hypothetical protein